MIWVWLYDLWLTVVRLLLPPPNRDRLRRVDPNGPCPACGNKHGQLRFMKTAVDKGKVDAHWMVVHTCGICGCSWGEPPVLVPKYPVDFSISNGQN